MKQSFFPRVLQIGKWLALALIFCAILLTPLIIDNVQKGYGLVLSTNNGIMMRYGNNPIAPSVALISWYPTEVSWPVERGELGESEADPILGDLAKGYIVEHPGRFLSKFPTFFFRYWLYPNEYWYQRDIPNKAYLWITFLIATIGAFIAITANWKKTSFIWAYFLMMPLPYMIVFYLARYKVPLIPFKALFIGVAIMALLPYLKPSRWIKYEIQPN